MDRGPGRATIFRSKIPFGSTSKLASDFNISSIGTTMAQGNVPRAICVIDIGKKRTLTRQLLMSVIGGKAENIRSV
jgi:hypothetical protein